MLSIRGGGGGGGRGVGGGGGGLKLSYQAFVYLPLLHYWSLNCCHVALALICQAMVRLL